MYVSDSGMLLNVDTVELSARKKLQARSFIIPGIILLVLLMLSAGLYYYFAVYAHRERYSKVNSTVSEETYTQNGFKKIAPDGVNYYFFVPQRWSVIDISMNVYGDLLSGSNASMKKYPNTLGKETTELCDRITKEAQDALSKNSVYSNINRGSFAVEKIGDFSGCYAEFSATVARQQFQVKQFYIFREDAVYLQQVQYPDNLTIEKETADLIQRSIIISE
jgi:hypothetical protein